MRLTAAMAKAAKLAAAAALLLALAAGPAGAQEHFLWSVEDGAGAELFLFGSIHLASEDMYPLPEVVEKAFASSDQLVVEANVARPDVLKVMASFRDKGLYLDGDESLWQDIGPELASGLTACANKIGLGAEFLDRLKPWLAAITVETFRLNSLGLKESLGVDRHFLGLAQDRGMAVGELEGLEEQLVLLTSFSDEESLQLLEVTVHECGDLQLDVRELTDIWKKGDLDAFERLYFQVYAKYPKLAPLMNRVIFDRNDSMHERLQPYLQPGLRTFVVIGAAHMVGRRGLPELFRAQGLKVTRY
jgi:uncharacterized protein YbaP (TraB family)